MRIMCNKKYIRGCILVEKDVMNEITNQFSSSFKHSYTIVPTISVKKVKCFIFVYLID